MPRTRLLAVIAMLSILAAGTALGQWQVVQRLTNTTDNSSLPIKGRSMAVTGAIVNIAYTDKLAGVDGVLGLRSTDKGWTWTGPTYLDSTASGNRFNLIADGAGNLHLFVCRTTGSVVDYLRSTDSGATWSAPVHVSNSYAQPSVAADNGTNVYMADASPDGSNVLAWRSTDAGQTWTGPETVATGAAMSGVMMVADDHGRVSIGWRMPDGARVQQIHFCQSTDNGATWGADHALTSGSSNFTPSGLYGDHGDHLVYTFVESGSDNSYIVSNNAGGSWGSEQSLPWSGATIGDCSADASNHLYLLSVIATTKICFYTAGPGMTSLSDTFEISSEPATASRNAPEILIDDATSYIHAAWVGRDQGNKDIYYRSARNLGGIAGPSVSAPVAQRLLLTPNPARSAVTWLGAAGARLYDRAGQSVTVLRPGSNDISRLPAGVYFVIPAQGSGSPLARLTKLD